MGLGSTAFRRSPRGVSTRATRVRAQSNEKIKPSEQCDRRIAYTSLGGREQFIVKLNAVPVAEVKDEIVAEISMENEQIEAVVAKEGVIVAGYPLCTTPSTHNHVKKYFPCISAGPQNKEIKLFKPKILRSRFIVDIKATKFAFVAPETYIVSRVPKFQRPLVAVPLWF